MIIWQSNFFFFQVEAAHALACSGDRCGLTKTYSLQVGGISPSVLHPLTPTPSVKEAWS